MKTVETAENQSAFAAGAAELTFQKKLPCGDNSFQGHLGVKCQKRVLVCEDVF